MQSDFLRDQHGVGMLSCAPKYVWVPAHETLALNRSMKNLPIGYILVNRIGDKVVVDLGYFVWSSAWLIQLGDNIKWSNHPPAK